MVCKIIDAIRTNRRPVIAFIIFSFPPPFANGVSAKIYSIPPKTIIMTAKTIERPTKSVYKPFMYSTKEVLVLLATVGIGARRVYPSLAAIAEMNCDKKRNGMERKYVVFLNIELKVFR